MHILHFGIQMYVKRFAYVVSDDMLANPFEFQSISAKQDMSKVRLYFPEICLPDILNATVSTYTTRTGRQRVHRIGNQVLNLLPVAEVRGFNSLQIVTECQMRGQSVPPTPVPGG